LEIGELNQIKRMDISDLFYEGTNGVANIGFLGGVFMEKQETFNLSRRKMLWKVLEESFMRGQTVKTELGREYWFHFGGRVERHGRRYV